MQLTRTISFVTIACAVVISGLLFVPVRHLSFTYDIESFFDPTDPEVQDYKIFKQSFGSENDFVLIGLPAKGPSIYEPAFLNQVDALREAIGRLDSLGVKSVTSITNLKRTIIGPTGPVQVPVLHLNDSIRLRADGALLKGTPMQGSLVAANGSSLAMVVKLNTDLAGVKTLNAIKDALQSAGFEQYHLAGRLVTQSSYKILMGVEGRRFATVSIGLIIIMLFWVFRAWWAVMLPLLVVGIGVLWTLGLIGLSGLGVDLIMMLMPTILFVVGISNVIHFLSKYVDALRVEPDKVTALNKTIARVLLPTFLTALTTAIGFVTLHFIPVPPLQRFGWFVAIGVMVCFVLSFTVLPALLLLLPTPRLALKQLGDNFWYRRLVRWYTFSIKNGRILLVSAAVIATGAIAVVPTLQENNFFLDDLSQDHSLIQDMQFFERDYAGIRPVEVKVMLKEKEDIYDLAVLKELDRLEQFMVDSMNLGGLVAPTTVFKGLNMAANRGIWTHYTLPADQETLTRQLKRVNKKWIDRSLSTMRDSSGQCWRITAKGEDIGSHLSLQQYQMAERFVNQSGFQHIDVKFTGAAHLMDKTNGSISRHLLTGLLVAVGMVSLLVGLLFRSIKVVVFSMIPNLLPLLVVAAVMAVFNVHLKVGTAMIFTIVFGIAVDDTIHFLTRFYVENKRHRHPVHAMRATYTSTGKAVILTSVIICSGFLVFTTSELGSTASVGVFVLIALLVALVADLLLLPTLLLKTTKPVFYQRNKQPSVKGQSGDD